MEVLTDRRALFEWRNGQGRSAARPRVLVPTMGALHEGHLSLMDRARELAGAEGSVVVSLFVNPTQFGPGEDFEAYPRDLQRDLDACRQRGVDVVFAPQATDVYAADASISVHESALSRGLCGASRPGHFDGVCTVVTKLFNLIQPDSAVFGEKDYQQLAVIRRLARDLDLPVEIIGAPLVREPDGLAMSSRNLRLSAEERRAALSLSRGLRRAETALASGERSGSALVNLARAEMEKEDAPPVRVDYIAWVHPQTLVPLEVADPATGGVLAVAAHVGPVRLIDNFIWPPDGSG